MNRNEHDDQQVDGATPGEVPVRPLRGMGTLYRDVEESLSRIRARQAELARKKRADFFRDPEPSDD